MISRILVWGGVLVAAATAQAAPRSIYFWSSSVGNAGMKAAIDVARPGTWGNGKYEDARRVLYEGAPTLKITTRNFREGVRFDVKDPIDIEPFKTTGFIRLRVRFKQNAAAGSGTPGGAAAGGPGIGTPGGAAPAPGGVWGGGGAGGGAATPFNDTNLQIGPLPPLGAMPGLPAGGTEAIVTGPPPQQTAINQLLCTLVLDNGVMEGTIDIPRQWNDPTLIDFDKVRPDADGWLMFVLPVSAMHATPGASGNVKRLLLSGDQEDSFYLTQVALVAESPEMKVSIRRFGDPVGKEQAVIQVRPGPLTLVADVEGGAADPAVEWNFDAGNVGNLPPPKWEGAPGAAQPAPDGGPVAALPPAPGAPPVPGVDGAQPVEAPIGPRIDARGLVAKFEYPDEEQNYLVEVTVRDRSGKKKEVHATVKIEVRANPGG